MRIFTARKAGSHLALALALATGTAVVGAVAFPEAAYAQKEDLSKEYGTAYNEIATKSQEEGADLAALKPELVALAGISESDDERFRTGDLMNRIGGRTKDFALQFQGVEMMLGTERLGAENRPTFNFAAYQLANNVEDYTKAEQYLQKAIDLGYAGSGLTTADLQINMANIFIDRGDYKGGYARLQAAIDSQKASGATVDESWYKFGFSSAYNNEIRPEVYTFTAGWVSDYANETNWREAVNIYRNMGDYEGEDLLDLLRLSRKVGGMQYGGEYLDYVEAAGPVDLPLEVKEVIEEGYATGLLSRDEIYAADSLSAANAKIQEDRSELPLLKQDAMASDATARLVMNIADLMLGYADYEAAAELYQKALGMPGVDAGVAATRLGIAQVEQGKLVEAKATFDGIEGDRKPIALLWSVYIDDMMEGSSSTPLAGA
ncbi:MAG: hypothetical protein AAGK02_03470 [Pseudomonadota bacterium]